jgi:hypothetical protein
MESGTFSAGEVVEGNISHASITLRLATQNHNYVDYIHNLLFHSI